jgi:hypothetical protein
MSMSWTGIAMFAALAIGAPIGMALYQGYGLQAAMIACIVAPLIAAVIAFREVSYTSPSGQRLPFYQVIGQIWREGLGLMLQGVGLSGLTAFASLYFAARGLEPCGLVMTAFGIGFIFVRVVFGSLPDKMSGYRVALWSLVIEAIGQAMLWLAPYEIVALAGALVTGLGCALVFPALGVEALKRVLPPIAAARWGRSSPSWTSPTASLARRRRHRRPVRLCRRLPVRRRQCAARRGTRHHRPQSSILTINKRRNHMSRIFISGSSTGLGLMAANCSSNKVIRLSCMPATPTVPKTPAENCQKPKPS